MVLDVGHVDGKHEAMTRSTCSLRRRRTVPKAPVKGALCGVRWNATRRVAFSGVRIGDRRLRRDCRERLFKVSGQHRGKPHTQPRWPGSARQQPCEAVEGQGDLLAGGQGQRESRSEGSALGSWAQAYRGSGQSIAGRTARPGEAQGEKARPRQEARDRRNAMALSLRTAT